MVLPPLLFDVFINSSSLLRLARCTSAVAMFVGLLLLTVCVVLAQCCGCCAKKKRGRRQGEKTRHNKMGKAPAQGRGGDGGGRWQRTDPHFGNIKGDLQSYDDANQRLRRSKGPPPPPKPIAIVPLARTPFGITPRPPQQREQAVAWQQGVTVPQTVVNPAGANKPGQPTTTIVEKRQPGMMGMDNPDYDTLNLVKKQDMFANQAATQQVSIPTMIDKKGPYAGKPNPLEKTKPGMIDVGNQEYETLNFVQKDDIFRQNVAGGVKTQMTMDDGDEESKRKEHTTQGMADPGEYETLGDMNMGIFQKK